MITEPDHGDNGGPKVDAAFEAIVATIDDLYDEAKNWADGEPIASAEIAEAVTKLFDGLGAAGKEAETLRVAEVKPLDDAKSAIQARFHPLIGDTKSGKGKVVRGRAALQTLLTAWRVEQQRIAALAAAKAREEAEAITAAAEAAIRASAGNLAEREEAEELLDHAKQATRFANRQDKAATTGTGLRTTWAVQVASTSDLLDWAYGRDPVRIIELAKQMADEAVRSGVREIPGCRVVEEKEAA